jgi:hypothetical protein
MHDTYLTESTLGEYLTLLFPQHVFVHNKQVPNSNSKYRPDYRCDSLMLIVEFNGYVHYTSARQQHNDSVKRNIYESMGYTVIEIPYFVQFSKDIVQLLFSKYAYNELEQYSTYSHGFIDSKATLPCDFNTAGYARFIRDLSTFDIIRQDIKSSLQHKQQYFNYKIF